VSPKRLKPCVERPTLHWAGKDKLPSQRDQDIKQAKGRSLIKIGHKIIEQKKLFTFKLPTHFFVEDNEYRLYESLLPFLPRHNATAIYFSDCYDPALLKTGLFRFDEETHAVSEVSPRLITSSLGESFFSPLSLNVTTFYGGTLALEGSGEKRCPALWINDDGLLCVELPAVFED